MSAASKVRCGIVYDKQTGEIKRIVKADTKAAMIVGANVQSETEELFRLKKDTYNNFKSHGDLREAVSTIHPVLAAKIAKEKADKVALAALENLETTVI